MGWFSDEIRTTVATTVSRVVEDARLPNSSKTGLVKAILNDGDIPAYVMEDLVGSIGVKAERMYDYAKAHYPYGLPSGQFKSITEGAPAVTAVLSTLEGTAVAVNYSHYGPPNKLHIGWLTLMAAHGYNAETNELMALTASIGFSVYLKDMTVVVPESLLASYSPTMLDQWGVPATSGYTPERTSQSLTGIMRAPTPVLALPNISAAYIRVDYVWVSSAQTHTGSFNISLDGYNGSLDYFQASYTVGTTTKYWMYEDNSGIYPTLDSVFATISDEHGTFFPFTYFRYNHVSDLDSPNSVSYKVSKKMLSYLGLPYDRIAAGVIANPNIAIVEQAMVVMAVPANTSDPIEQRYLFSFFEAMFASNPTQFTTYAQSRIAAVLAANNNLNTSNLVIQDARFRTILSNQGVFKKRISGSIGVVGTYSSGMSTTAVEEGSSVYHYYRHQVSHALYDEIQVVGLQMVFSIYNGYSTIADDIGEVLLVPIDRSISSQLSTIDKEKLYSRSLYYVFNSMQQQTIKWYQQEWFRFVMIIVAVVVTVYTMGADGGTFLAALLAGEFTVAATLAWPLLLKLLEGFLIGVALKLFVKVVGVEVGLILAIIAAAVASYNLYEAGGQLAKTPWAGRLLALSSGLSQGVNAELKNMYGELIEEYETLNLLKDRQTKELEVANKLLEHKNYLNPFVIFGEKPEDYYNRTVHSGNIGVLALGAISSYVDIALTLPQLRDTIEGQFT